MVDSKVVERKLLLKRLLTQSRLFTLGKSLDNPYFNSLTSQWDMDADKAAFEVASNINDAQLEGTFRKPAIREWEVFRGQHYTFENGELRLDGSWKEIQAAIKQVVGKYGKTSVDILKRLAESGQGCSLKKIRQGLPDGVDPLVILEDLERLKIVVTSYKGKELQEWTVLEETAPLIRAELGLVPREVKIEVGPFVEAPAKADPIDEERRVVEKMSRELDDYLSDLLKHRSDETVEFGRTFSIAQLAGYLKDLFGPVLYFDSLLSLTQQYGLPDVDIVHAKGRTGMRTGWNLSLFGEPGTGKSFSVRDIILGKLGAKISPHGVPGRNRYAGGITPARFIRIGTAYTGQVFNFIVPEFNDWFKYKGMVEPLKLAMERGEIMYEMHREVVGPYRFSSFFSVNYNVAALGRGYEVTIQDPNFSAIEDRMLCRLHRLTKQRYVEIAESQIRLAFGEIDVEKGAQQIRDHLTLVYAAETGHPLVRGRFPAKPVLLTPKAQRMLMKARKAVLEEIPQAVLRFSARLEDRALRFACAASLLGYFQSNLAYVPVSEDALKYAIQLYVEEAAVRSREEFLPGSVLSKIAWE